MTCATSYVAPSVIELTRNHMGMIHKMAYGFSRKSGGNSSFEDLVQVGFIAALKARETYNPEKSAWGTHFYLALKGSMIRFCQMDRVIRPTFGADGRLTQANIACQSMDRELGAQRPEADGQTLHSIIPDTSLQPDRFGRGSVENSIMDRIESVGLNERERTILRMRYLSEQGATLKEIANVLCITKERVRQIEEKLICRLRKVLSQG